MSDYAVMIDDEIADIHRLIDALCGQSVILEQVSDSFEDAAANALIMRTVADELNGVCASLDFIAESMKRDSDKAPEIVLMPLP